MDSQATISYLLFQYNNELRRSNSRNQRLCRTKLSLTDKLVSKNFRNIKTCSMEDLKAINREIVYKKKLQKKIKKSKPKTNLDETNLEANKATPTVSGKEQRKEKEFMPPESSKKTH